MISFRILGTMLLALMIFGCNQSEESKSVQGTTETTTEKVTEAAKTAAGEVKEMAVAVSDKAVELEKQAEPAIKEATSETKEMAVAAVDKTGEVLTEAKDSTVKATKTAAVATTMAAEKVVDAAKQAVSPETIVFDASYGKVTFPHEMHSGNYDCSTCHGEETPGLFGLDKEKAHALCKDCHKKIGAGPADCKGCHKK